MSDELKNISPEPGNNREQEKLLQYLHNNMQEDELHEFESAMNDDEFMNDAVEGLQALENKNNIPLLVQQLNSDLKKQLEKKKRRKEKRKIQQQPWVYLSVLLILLLAVIAYVIIRKLN